MELSPTTPLDPLERRAERYLAMVLLALVASPTEPHQLEARSARAPAPRGAPRPRGAAPGRHVRPPRSC